MTVQRILCSSLIAGTMVAAGQQSTPANPSAQPPYAAPPTLPDNKSPQQPDTSMSPDQAATDSGSQTATAGASGVRDSVEGCLTHMATVFSIEDRKSGKVYIVQGKSEELASALGQQVNLIGIVSQPTPVSKGRFSETTNTPPATLEVTEVRKIADHCEPPER